MTKAEKIASFNPNNAAASEQVFGLPFNEKESEIIIIPAPWEATVSYSAGTANGPKSILEASWQVDLFDPNLKNAWQRGIFMLPISQKIKQLSTTNRKIAEKIICAIESGTEVNYSDLETVNSASTQVNEWIKEQAKKIIKTNKIPVLIGGDHSTPFGLIEALSEQNNFGILQIDAHADLREAYEGFKYSHASIIHNLLSYKNISNTTQVGIRDICESEFELINSSEKINTFFDWDLSKSEFNGKNWDSICLEIIETLPKNIYITVDIDGLSPDFCQSTGTPVPGGLSFNKLIYLFEKIVESEKKIIAFDIVEVAPGETEYEANVAARLLYKLCNLTLKSQGK